MTLSLWTGHMDVGTRQAKTFSSSTSNGLIMADIESDTRPSPDGRSALPKLHSQDAFVRVHVNSQREKLESNYKDIKCDSSKIHSPVIMSPTERRSNVFKGHLFCFSDSFPADRVSYSFHFVRCWSNCTWASKLDAPFFFVSNSASGFSFPLWRMNLIPFAISLFLIFFFLLAR